MMAMLLTRYVQDIVTGVLLSTGELDCPQDQVKHQTQHFYFILILFLNNFLRPALISPPLGTPPLCAGRGVAWGEFLSHHIILILSSFGIVDIVSFSSNLYDFCPFEIKQTPGEQSSQCFCLHSTNLGSLGS